MCHDQHCGSHFLQPSRHLSDPALAAARGRSWPQRNHDTARLEDPGRSDLLIPYPCSCATKSMIFGKESLGLWAPLVPQLLQQRLE